MSKAAEELLLKYERERSSAEATAKQLADRIIMAMHNANYRATLVSMDLDEVDRLLARFREEHDKVIEADRGMQRVRREALANG